MISFFRISLFSLIFGVTMTSVDEPVSSDIVMHSDPILSRSNKRGINSVLLTSPSPLNVHFIGSIVYIEDNVFEIIASNGTVCTLKSSDNLSFECSKLELYPGEKYQRCQKRLSLEHPYVSKLNVKDPVSAASFLLKSPMLFKSSIHDISFIVNYTGIDANLYEFTKSGLSDTLLSWDIQLRRCLLAAPQVPSDYEGDLITLAALPRDGIVLLGSKRDSSFGKDVDASENGLVFYASRTTKGRGHILFLEVSDRFQDVRKNRNHYFTASNNEGSFCSCFYFDTDSSFIPKAVAFPLILEKKSESITNHRVQAFVCYRILKEMNGAVLASLTVTKKAKSAMMNPLTSPQVSTKVKLIMTPVERLILHFNSISGVPSS